MTLERRPFWLQIGEHDVAVWLLSPASARVRQSGVLLCPGFGHDYTHGYRTVARTAEAFARAGYLTARLDYPGTGNSTGDESTPDLFDLWIEAVDGTVDALEALTGGPAILVGLRLGAAIAGRVAERRDVRHFIGWSPVVRGKRYVRELRALSGFSTSASDSADDYLEAGGFRLSRATCDRISGVDLRRSSLRVTGEALIIERDDLPAPSDLPEHLTASGIDTTRVSQAGYLDMLAEPQFTVVPLETIAQMTRWATEREAEDAWVELDRGAMATLTARTTVSGGARRETLTLLACGDGVELFGVLTEAETAPASDDREEIAVVLPNAGSVHTVGPNRFYVELARHLAAEGVSSFRLDLRNLGDSSQGVGTDDNHPYPDTAVEDVGLAASHLAHEGIADALVVGGLCSGAYYAFRAALELVDQTLLGLLCVNPLTFRWKPGMSLDTPDTHRAARQATFYKAAIADRESWIRLLTGQSDLGAIARFVISRPFRLAALTAHSWLGTLRLRAPTPLEAELEHLDARGLPITFVFSSNDPGPEILRTEAQPVVRRLVRSGRVKIETIPDADHTFSRAAQRRMAIDRIVESVLRH